MQSQSQLPLPCKVCDRGVLVSKKIFRMSGPVVAIGYILLIPSILGMTIGALMLFGMVTYNGNEPTAAHRSTQSRQELADMNFRRSCAASFVRSFQQTSTGLAAPNRLVAEYCECALGSIEQGNSITTAEQLCLERYTDQRLIVPSQEIQDLYATFSESAQQLAQPQQLSDSGTDLARVIGGSFALVILITSFVGGLLGWLLVIKKKVLKCNVCGAIINAS